MLAASAVVALGPVARAESGTTTAPRSVITKPEVSLTGSAVSVQAMNTITRGAWSCTLTVSDPGRWFGCSGGGAQGPGWLDCTHVMPQLEIFVGVVRNNTVVALATDYDTATIQVNTNASVSPTSGRPTSWPPSGPSSGRPA
ncbi:hypothetical protein CKY47_29705 [Saccharothrix yanglingensis]|uniref:Secreted protein n=1 Tax=Saccharothrix yanglingensis TaxID=659496 RepID=A0ABU0X7G3_9PSEU|nr:hypothetical protein [Saccharothrix yanglingensis]